MKLPKEISEYGLDDLYMMYCEEKKERQERFMTFLEFQELFTIVKDGVESLIRDKMVRKLQYSKAMAEANIEHYREVESRLKEKNRYMELVARTAPISVLPFTQIEIGKI